MIDEMVNDAIDRPGDREWAPRQAPNACCLDARNLVTAYRDDTRLVRRCSECGRRHFRLTAKPMDLRQAGIPLGSES